LELEWLADNFLKGDKNDTESWSYEFLYINCIFL